MIWWLQFGCKERWTPLLITWFYWSVNVKSVQGEEMGRIWVGSDISWFKLQTVKNSICCPSFVILSSTIIWS